MIYLDRIIASNVKFSDNGQTQFRHIYAENWVEKREEEPRSFWIYTHFAMVAEAYQAFYAIMQIYVGFNPAPDKAAAMEFEMTAEVKTALFSHPQFKREVEVSGGEDAWWAIVPVENKVETYKVVFDDGKYATWLAQQG